MATFDVIIVGGGHAGTEAAAAAARCGARVALVTFDRATLGAMSCNPAIGGIGKGHLVREVDAFDGLMARAADAAAIHYRMLNRSKGLAVRGPRIQADRKRYAAAIRAMLHAEPLLTVVEGEAASLCLKGGRVTGLALEDGNDLTAPAVVLATGTFLGGKMFRGEEQVAGGRIGERAAHRLGDQLRALSLPMGRLKTGTPPRLDGRTIDWAMLGEQPSDADGWTMSTMTVRRPLPQVACAITRTNDRTHDIIRAAMDRSPLFSGAIAAKGPRYCPSIEDKVARFGDRDGHQIFLEPEGLDDHRVYPNGISTSLPIDVQAEMIASIEGLGRATIVTPGYAIEYDYLDPRSLDHRLMLAAVPGLFAAGQINGTTGYEEAAGQGLIAGLNAAAAALGRPPTVLDRAGSYLGVMIDDLVLQGVTEPYRMLTSRAENRLRLRADNAETRLSDFAEAAGCVGEARLQWFEIRQCQRRVVEDKLAIKKTGGELRAQGFDVAASAGRRSIGEWSCVSGIDARVLLSDMGDIKPDVILEALEDVRYAPYLDLDVSIDAEIKGDSAQIGRVRYAAVPGLSQEMIERLSAAQPATLAEASRIRGISPAALSAILLHVKRAA